MTASDMKVQVKGPTTKVDTKAGEESFKFRFILRLSTFQIGSAMADILMTSVWNRIMISNFGIPAWPVGLLIALRYLLFPLSLWAGYQSDNHPILRLHRTPYIWFGRFLMFISFPFLGLSLGRLADNSGDVLGWLLALLCFLLYGAGTLISGSPFLALVRDSAPKEKQGLAISTVQTVLIAFFPVSAIAFGYWLETYNQTTFWQVIFFTMIVAAFFWIFAIIRMEKPKIENKITSEGPTLSSFIETFKKIWNDRRTRHFFAFLAVGTVAAWAQDNVLEPFGAEVFDMPVGQTTRLNAYWQGPLVVVLVLVAFIRRKYPPEEQTGITRFGLVLMTFGMVLLGLSSIVSNTNLVIFGLVIFGAGFGFFTFGAFSLLAVMTTDIEAGAYLSLWTICILVSRGLGISLGSILRDIFIALTNTPELAYGAIFFLEAVGLLVAAQLLSKRDILGFARDSGRINRNQLSASATDM
ncbi:MAG: BCD family MFS transporter [Anaerolineae bacterium]|nr:MAG: BCD family MFS transporter [Anaerolineae bacterium]